MPLPYRKVSDLYKTLKDAGVVTTDLPSWSEEMNRLSQSDLYSAGLQDNFVKQASVGLDRLLEKTGLPQVSGDVGAAVGGLIGAPDVGRQIGESTPRLGVGMLGFLGGPVAGAATLGALTGTEAYTATGSPAAGVVSGAVNAAMPGAMNVLEKAAFRQLGGKLLSGPLADAAGNITSTILPRNAVALGTTGQKFGAFTAGQVGGAVFGEAGTALGAAVDPNAEYQFDPKAALLGATLGQAPFTALHLASKVTGRAKETMTPQQLDAYLQSSAKNIELKAARDKAAEKSPLETHPLAEPLPPGKVDLRTQAETDAVLDRIRGRKAELKAEPTEDSVRELDKLDAEELELIAERARGGATDDTIFGRSLPRQEELAPLADPASDPLVFGKELSDVAAKMQPDMGFDDFRAVVEEMNAVRAKHKAPLMTDDTIKRYAKKWNIKDPQEAVRGIVNAEVLGTEAATQQSVTQAHVDAFAEALKDPEVMALATELEGKGRPGSFQKAVVQWINDGKPGGAEGLKSRALKAKKKGGTGAPMVVKTEVAAKADVPETAHVTRVRAKAATRATEIVTPDLQGEAQEFRAAFADGSITGKEYQELLQSEHWQEWLSDANEELKMMGEHGNMPMAVPNVPAGGGFTWDKFSTLLKENDQFGNRKHLRKDGTMARKDYEKALDDGLATNVERDLAKVVVPEAFDTEGNVNVRVLMKGLKEKGPVVEVKKLGGPKATDIMDQQLNAMTHELDTRQPGWRNALTSVRRQWSPESQELYRRYEQLRDQQGNGRFPSDRVEGAPKYSFLGPKSKQEMPGYVEGLVRAPATRKRTYEERSKSVREKLEKEQGKPLSPEQEALLPKLTETFADEQVNNTKYTGPHFGSEDTNVLAFFRGYEETLPDGRKAFHVIEVQSDWGQQRQKSEKNMEAFDRTAKAIPMSLQVGERPPLADGRQAKYFVVHFENGDGSKSQWELRAATPEEAISETRSKIVASRSENKVSPHPLLTSYETLALKAAIDHARSVGAEAIILSDGETAMMTEGHDKAKTETTNALEAIVSGRFGNEVEVDSQFEARTGIKTVPSRSEPNVLHYVFASPENVAKAKELISSGNYDNQPSQSAGMRLHYDTTLPSAMKKLTGVEGERVEVGTHVKGQSQGQLGFDAESNPIQGSPVFRNPDGTPKSSITGRLYPLDKAAAKFDAQGGPTLTDPSRAPGAGGTDAIPWTPVTLDEQARYTALSPDSGGIGLLRELQRSADGATRALADGIAKQFPESLKRVAVRIMQMSREGYAQQRGNREVDVVLSHGILMSNDPVRREQVMMHELLHGLSVAEIDNPVKAPLVQELDALRERLIAGLPREIRLRIKFAIDDGWYSAYATGKPFKGRRAEMSDLGPKEYQQIAYGLLNTKELLTQGFTSKQMQRHMQLLKGPTKKGFGVFVDYVKRLLGFGGEVSDSEFAHFLDASSRLLKQGEYVSDLSNFTDQWFAQKGLSPARVREQSRRALEVVQSTNVMADKELMLTTLAQHQPQSQEFVNAKKMLDKMWADGGEHADSATAVLSELNIPTGELDSALVLHIAQHEPLFHEAMDVMPEPVTSYLFARARDMKSVLESVDAAVSEKNDGLINIANPAELRSPVRETVKALDRFLKLEDKRQIERGMLMRMSVAPDAFFDQVQNGLSAAPEAFDAIDEGVPMSKIGEWITPPAQIARSNPLFAEWYSRALLMPAKIREQVLASMKVISRDIRPDGSLGPENDKATLERRFKMLESPTLQKGIDRLLWKKQELGKESNKVVQLPYDGAEFKEITKGMKPEDVKNLIEFDNIIRLSKHAADMQTLDALRQDLSMRAARLPMKDEGMKLAVANDAATQLFDALNENFNDPASAAKANAKIQAVQSRMQPQSFLNLLKFTENSVAYHKELSLHLLNNPDWVTASRMKDFKFEYFKGNKRVLASANTMKEAKQMAGGAEILNWKRNERSDDDPVFAGNNSVEFIEKLRQYEENQMEALKNYGASDDVKAAMERLSVVAQVERDLNFQGANLGNLIPPGRTLGKGADQLPWFENHVDWITKNAGYWQRRLLRTTAESMRLEPGTAGTDTADLIGKHAEEMFQRDPEIGRAVQKVAATWSLGFNLATQIANSTQTWMRGVTELIALGHGPVAALREMKGAWKDLIGKRIGQDKLTDPVENKFLADALHEGMLDATITDENAQANELSSVNLKRILNAEKPKTLGQHLGSAAGAYSNASMAIFRMGEYANNKAQLLATFRSLSKLRPDLGYAELKKQAYLVNASVNDVGGRANRPLGPYSGKGDFSRTAAMAATSMQSYVLGSTMQLVRNLKKGVLRTQGLTPAEVYSARKAAVYQLAVQFAAAGTLGMPFVSGALALLNQAFPELELNKNLRLGVSSLFGSDGENGHILSDIAMSGVPSMLGWDFSSRLNAGNLLPGVSEYNGFQPEQLLGVPASMVANFIKGGKKLAAGDLSGGYAFVPPAVKKLTELAMEGGQARDYRGRPLMTPTPGESIGLALGFQPTRLKDYNTADRMAQQSEHLQIVRKGQETQKLAEEVMKGNFGTVRAAMQSQMQADKNYNPADAVRSIARVAEEMTFPKDLRREGSRRDMDSRSKLLSSFNLDPVNVSEVARLQFRRQLEQRLGLTSDDSTALRKAQLMDQLRLQNPTATRASLSAAATSALRRTPASSLVLQ